MKNVENNRLTRGIKISIHREFIPFDALLNDESAGAKHLCWIQALHVFNFCMNGIHCLLPFIKSGNFMDAHAKKAHIRFDDEGQRQSVNLKRLQIIK